MRRELRALIAWGLILGSSLPALGQGREVWPNTTPALSNSAQTVLSQAGTLIAFSCYNPNAVAGWVQVFDTVGSVTVGTTVPRVALPLPPASGSGVSVAAVPPATSQGGVAVSLPLSLSAGLKVAATTTPQGSTALSSAVSCDFFSR